MLSFSEEQQQQVQRSSIIYHASMRITRDNGHNTTTTKNSSIDSNRSHSLTIYSCCDKYEKCPCSGWHKNCSHFFTHNRYQNRCKTSQNLPAIISCGDHFIQFISVEVASVDNAIPSLVFCRMPFKVNENIYISNEKVKKMSRRKNNSFYRKQKIHHSVWGNIVIKETKFLSFDSKLYFRLLIVIWLTAYNTNWGGKTRYRNRCKHVRMDIPTYRLNARLFVAIQP